LDEVVIQRARLLRRCRVIEAGAPSLAAISIECELGHQQKRSAGFDYVAVHLAVVVRKDTQAEQLAEHIVRIESRIGAAYTHKCEQSLTYRSNSTFIYSNCRLCYPLNQ